MKHDRILLAHGGGGSLTKELVEQIMLPALDNPVLRTLDDAAVVGLDKTRLAFTTDAYVVRPIFFPGGDIGRLAVCGTVNDLAMQGAQPLWLSLSLILEEGLTVEDLRKIVTSIRAAADEAGVTVVTGDTKVVERGKCEGIYITTAGIGRLVAEHRLGSAHVKPGDAVILSGPIGDHGVAVLSQREGIRFSTSVVSDCAPLWSLVERVLATGAEIHALRDPTRGGLATALGDIARASGVGVRIEECRIPIRREVLGACELLGLDPLTIANEGKLLAVVAAADAERVVAAMNAHPLGREARLIGEVVASSPGLVWLATRIGGERIVDMPTGEDLPRIC